MKNALFIGTLPLAVLIISSELMAQKPASEHRYRIVISSDFPPLNVIPGGAGYGPADKRSDPDDIQSMVRFLLYSNDFDIEGLIASSGTFANIANKQYIIDLLNIYDKVDDNLRRHDPGYPTAEQLRAVTWEGRSGSWGKSAAEIIGVESQ